MRERAEVTGLWRRSGALRWTVYLLLILVVPQTCLWVTLDTVNRRAVERKLQAIRHAGEPVTMSECAPAPVPDDQNAAVLYQQVFRVDFSARTYSSATSHSLFAATGHSKLIEGEFSRDRSKAAQARAVLNAPAVIGILETLEQASMRPDCVFPLSYDDGPWIVHPHMARFRQAARWLARKATICTMDDDPDEALRWLAVLLRMSDHTTRDPNIIAPLVAVAIQSIGLSELERTLSKATPSAEATQNLLDCLERLDLKQGFDQALRGDRAQSIDSYALFRHAASNQRWPTLASIPQQGLAYCYQFRLFRPLYNADLSKYLTLVEDSLHRAEVVPAPPTPPLPPERGRLFGLDLDLKQVVDLLYYAGGALEKRDASIMNIDIARVALALTLYKIEHGDYPPTLEDLQATLDWELPRDFFANAPLTYQRRADGFLLYSFGIDRDDDGGASPRAPGYSWEDYDAVWECKAP